MNRYPEKPLSEFPRDQWRKKTELKSLAKEGKTLGAGLHRIGSQGSSHTNLVIEFGFVSDRCYPRRGILRKLTLQLGQQQVLFEGEIPPIKKHGVVFLRPWHSLDLKLVKTDADGGRKQQGPKALFAIPTSVIRQKINRQNTAKWASSKPWIKLFHGQLMAKTLTMLELDYRFT
ncbi:hypothetical protein [Endozoicomonas sp. ALC066]|uniref:hypothetical protein n=1 Tax=Endozoicomonas sp. ALC066 TaxID=3403078 RepID=UPI003BB5E731